MLNNSNRSRGKYALKKPFILVSIRIISSDVLPLL